jgi:hypothetical protein
MGRLKIHAHLHGLRFTEVRWMGPKVQWVLSPVQVALWTGMGRPQYRGFSWCPIRRWPPVPMSD